MISFPSIESFKSLIFEVTNDTRGKDELNKSVPLPTLDFIATTKIHGSNAGITYYKSNNKLVAQSRSRVLSLEHDNMGFCSYVLKNEFYWKNLCEAIVKDYDSVTIFGEWAGPGIQSGVAVSKLPEKIFVIFSILFKNNNENFWVNTSDLGKYIPECVHNINSYIITEFGTWNFTIDFNRPELVQNKLTELTEEIEKECPVGKYFGISDVGEGIVLTHSLNYKVYKFKVKGTKHSNSKIKILVPVNEEEYKNIQDFVNNYMTESRLQQGIFWMKNEMELDIDIKNIGAFIKWVIGDVFKEESKNIAANNLDVKKVAKEIGNIAREFFMKNYA